MPYPMDSKSTGPEEKARELLSWLYGPMMFREGLPQEGQVVEKIAAAIREAQAEAYWDAATMNCCRECDEGADDMRAKARALRQQREQER